jgi:hypothetical protein
MSAKGSCGQVSARRGSFHALCRTHHCDIHSFGDEDPVATPRMLWISTRSIE